MSWNHIVIEGYCMYTDEEAHADKNINDYIKMEGMIPPKCCMKRPGLVGSYCLKFDDDQDRYSPFLAFGTSRSSVVLTNIEGQKEHSKIFWTSDDLTDEKWIEREKQWIDTWKKRISE